MSVPTVSFPEDLPTDVRAVSRNRTLVYLLKVLSYSGYSVGAIYLVCVLLLKPTLKLNFDRRLEFMRHAFEKVTQLYKDLKVRVKHVPSVEIRYDGRVYKDEMVSTDDFTTTSTYDPWKREEIQKVTLSSGPPDYNERSLRATGKVANSLENLKRSLSKMKVPDYKEDSGYVGTHAFRNGIPGSNNSANVSEMQPLLFQIKQLKNYMEMVNADHPRDFFFKRSPLQLYGAAGAANKNKKENYVDNLLGEFDDIKDLVEQRRLVK